MIVYISMILALCGNDAIVRLSESWAEAFERNIVYHVVSDQILYWPLADQRTERMMELWFAPPNRFKALYSEPDSQIILADGSRIWTIVPDNNQVLYQQQDPTLTWHDTPLGELLSTEARHCTCDSSEAENSAVGELILSCEDFEAESQWVNVKLHIPYTEIWPRKAVLTDISDNKTTYNIRSWEELPVRAALDSLFIFRKPAGYDVVPVD